MLERTINEANQLTAFRFLFLPGVVQWSEAQSILRWARSQQVGMTSIAASGKIFRFKEAGYKRG
ncbi:hypothetical protein [Caballeronia sp. Lep1P3]|uniref:hypothetical protein n=1 Tax=Caballeronia sp. Lep1P3 TaxID=2878150 RepID=UPI00351D480F